MLWRIKNKMKKKVWIISISLIMLAPLLTLMVLYHLFKIQQPDQPPFFDLFIADTFYDYDDPIFYKVDKNKIYRYHGL